MPSGNKISFYPLANSIALIPDFSMRWIVPSGKILSSSPSSNMHLIVPSGNLYKVKFELYLHNFLRSIWEMFFNLLVWKLEYLEAIGEGSLCRFGLSKIVNYSLIWVSLLYIFIGKIHNYVSVWVGLSLNSIGKDNFLFAWLVYSLDFSIMAYNLIDHFLVFSRFLMVFL